MSIEMRKIKMVFSAKLHIFCKAHDKYRGIRQPFAKKIPQKPKIDVKKQESIDRRY